MPFSPQSKFSVRATLVDAAGKPRPDLTVQVRAAQAGDLSPLPAAVVGEGKSKEVGQLEILLAGDVLVKNYAVPAIELWLLNPGEQRWIAGALAGVSAADGAVVFDFGALVVFDAPLASVQERPLFGLPQPLHAPFRALELKLAEATKTLNAAKAAYTQVTAEKASLSQQLAELGKTLETTKMALEQANVERAALSTSLGATKQALEQVGAERAELAAKLAAREQALEQVTMERATLSKTLGVTQAALEQASTERAALADKLAERDQELAQALAELKTLGEEGPAAGLGEVVEGIGGQLKSVRESLEGGSFALGRVSLDLKVVPSGGGTKVAFPTRGELKSLPRDVISSLSLDFAAVAPTRPVVRGEEKQKLPDLSGDTEVMARRRLAALDLGVKVGQRELAPEDAKSVGRVVKQVPAPGTPVAAGAVVTILLGKPSRKV